MDTLKNFNLENLKLSVSTLKKKGLKLQKKEEEILKDKKENSKCLSYIEMILDTHSRETTPLHTSGTFLLFFIGQDQKIVLIQELSPRDDLMPEMQRISIKKTLKSSMKITGEGYVIQKVYFGTDQKNRTSQRFIICLERMIVETI